MKKTYPKKQLLLLLMTFCTMFLFSQNKNSYWEKASNEKNENELVEKETSRLKDFKVFKLDLNKFKMAIAKAPLRGSLLVKNSNIIIDFPNSDGEMESFRIVEASVMHPELQAQYPNIRSYAGQGIDDPSATIRFSISPQNGIASMRRANDKRTSFIELSSNQESVYRVFDRKNSSKPDFACHTEEEFGTKMEEEVSSVNKDADTGTFHTFRLALSCTGEYGAGAGGGTVPGVVAQFNTTMTRVNGIFENDFATTMILIPTNNSIIYLNAGTDPYPGANLNAELQANLTAVIGEANYDVGHIFNQAGNNGNAGCIGCICVDGQKGSAFTQSTAPFGVDFDVDFVAHEIGHQFGGNHTFTHNNEGTGANLEPGSGSTIMGYAGITGATDVQPHSDPYFHFFTIEQVTAHVASRNCDTEASLSQNTPTANAGADYNIPRGTPFKLTGVGTVDAAGAISYCWEQSDIGGPGNTHPSSTDTTGPSFRSLNPTASPTRYFPNLPMVVGGSLGNAGTPGDWEVLNTTARDYTFRLTVRDNIANGGQNKIDNMSVSQKNVTPFTVSAPNTAVSWEVGSAQTVTWVVGSTTNATINCQKVNIKLSIDGGFTYPVTILSDVTNDGSEAIVVPNNITANARIMVEAADNIFYDLSNTNFSIVAPTNPTFALSVPAVEKDQTICTGVSPVVNVAYEVFSGFSENTVFSATGNPAGSTVNFSTNNINSTQPVVMTLGNTAAITPGVYPVTITATSASVTRTEVINFTVYSSTFTTSSLIFPGNGITGVGTVVSLAWAADVNAESYDIQVATNAGFTTGLNTYNSSTNSYNLSGLVISTEYYWRVAPKNNCGTGAYSGAYSFTTVTPNCVTYNSTQNNITIPSTGSTAHVITSTRNITLDEVITDLNVTINVQHVWAGDMELKLTSPAGTEVLLLANSKCDLGIDDIAVTYDDEGIPLVCQPSLPGTPPAVGGTIIPEAALSAFDGESTMGNWVLTATDGFPSGDGGQFLNYSIQICSAPVLSVSENNSDSFEMYPNPSNGKVTISFKTNEAVQMSLLDVRGRKIYGKLYSNNSDVFSKEIDLSTIDSGVYLMNLSSGNKNVTKKLVIQ